MNRAEVLENSISSGSIRVVQLVGVPRSMSTALGRSLNESNLKSVFINEPFNRENQEYLTVASAIVDAAEDTSTEEPVIVITKNMASYLSSIAFREMASIAEATVWTVRDPLVQIGSLMTRLANDIAESPGADVIKQEELGLYIDDVCSFLENSKKSKDYRKTGWASIGEHYNVAASDNSKSLVVDGEIFVSNPEKVVKDICALVELPYSKNMVSNWSSGFINVINRQQDHETSRSAWTSHAAKSTGVVGVTRPQLNLSTLPKNLQKHISEVALPVYEIMTSDKAV